MLDFNERPAPRSGPGQTKTDMTLNAAPRAPNQIAESNLPSILDLSMDEIGGLLKQKRRAGVSGKTTLARSLQGRGVIVRRHDDPRPISQVGTVRPFHDRPVDPRAVVWTRKTARRRRPCSGFMTAS